MDETNLLSLIRPWLDTNCQITTKIAIVSFCKNFWNWTGPYWEQWRPVTEKRGGREPTRTYLLRPCLAWLAAAQSPRGILQRRHGTGRRGSSLEVETGGGSEIRIAFPVSPARFTSPTRRGRACTAGKRRRGLSDRRWPGGRRSEGKRWAGLGETWNVTAIGPCFFSLRFTHSIRNPFSFHLKRNIQKKVGRKSRSK
jgi:hypothetical protein